MKSSHSRAYLLLCLGLIVYALLRCIHVPLVHDEVATYIHYVHPQEFLPGQSLVDANNHLLNSALTIVSDVVFSTSAISLRLPNLLALLVLCFYTYRISQNFKSSLLSWFFVLSILGSHYMIEFHALSRGYGLSMAFLLGMVHHLQRFMNETRVRDGLLIVVMMFLALSANLSLLFVSIMVVMVLVYRILKINLLSKYWYVIAGSAIVIGAAIKHSFWLKSSGALYYGEGGGFWENTMETLSLYLAGNDTILPYIFLSIFLFSIVVLLLGRRSILALMDSQWCFHILLSGSLCGIFLAHILTETNFPEDRVGLYLYPLLMGAFITSLDDLGLKWSKTRYLGSIILIFPIHFLLNINLSHVDHWSMERVPEEFYDELEKFKELNGHMPTLSGYHTTALSYFMAGYLESRNVPALVHTGFPSEIADFIITRRAEEDLVFEDYQIVAEDGPSENKLWRRTQSLKRTKVDSKEGHHDSMKDLQFLEFMKLKVAGTSHWAIDFEVSYTTEDPIAKAHLVMALNNSDQEPVRYIPFELDWRQKGKAVKEEAVVFAKGSGDGEDELKFYLWNIDQKVLNNLDYKVQLYRLED